MHVPFVDLYSLHRPYEGKFLRHFKKVIKENAFVAGKYTDEFEKKFAQYCGAKYALLVNNGTSALFAACKALRLPPGSEVMIPTNTFIATAEAPLMCGLKPVFVDVDPTTLLIDLDEVAKKLSERTSAVIPVHLYGQKLDVAKLRKLIKTRCRKPVAIIEDACQAHGAKFKGRQRVEGDVACFSFYPGKNLGALGEAGAVVTNSRRTDSYARLFRGHGSKIKYHHELVGMNLRADEMQALFLQEKLQHLEVQNRYRVQAAALYGKLLRGVPQISFQSPVGDGSHVYHLFVIRAKQRNKLAAFLKQRGIDTGIHYPVPLHLTKAFSYLKLKKGSFPQSEKAAAEILSLPMFTTLTKAQINYVCENIKTFYSS